MNENSAKARASLDEVLTESIVRTSLPTWENLILVLMNMYVCI